ncbi:hypothetical protein N7536_011470 [Penicillium majusculum]|nr:hypothetical protein N7536_011470 [Penicillium majusculum]
MIYTIVDGPLPSFSLVAVKGCEEEIGLRTRNGVKIKERSWKVDPRHNNTIDTILAKNPILTWIFVDQSIISQGILRIVIGEWVGLSVAKMPSLVSEDHM